MSFDPKEYATAYVSVDEVLEIKKAFDLFDRDLGGAIDPRCTQQLTQNLKSLSTPSALRLKLRQSIK